jgi:hypothetical protein
MARAGHIGLTSYAERSMTRPSWEVEQARLTEEARLLLAPPSMVFEELKTAAQKARGARLLHWRPEKLEATLVERHDKLINLALASFGTDEEVFKALYKYSNEPAQDEADAQYKRGLRLGCLSNETIGVVKFVWPFPHQLIGNEEVGRIISSGEWSEIEALFGNPACSAETLANLFKGDGIFQQLKEERRAHIIHVAAKNVRINTDNSDNYDPDLGHYRIHRAITHLFENAPVTPLWFWTLYTVLENIDPYQATDSENIAAALYRWKEFEIYDSGDEKKPSEGHLTADLTVADEFRCMFASVFAGIKDDALKAAQKSDYLPPRCVYYSHARMKINDMKAGNERDKGAYVLAAAFNANVLFSQDMRRTYEEEQMHGRHIVRIYRRNVDFMRRRYRMPAVSLDEDEDDKRERASLDEVKHNEDNDRRLEQMSTEMAGLRRKVEEIAGKLASFQSIVIGAAIAYLAFLFLKGFTGGK